MMTLTPTEVAVAGFVVAAVFGLVCFFLKRMLTQVDKKTDDNSRGLQELKDTTVTKEDFREEVQKLDADVESIKASYVPRKEYKEDIQAIKAEFRDETKKLTADVEEIKANYLTRTDFYRVQARTDQQLEKILDVLMQMKGDRANGKE